MNIHQIILSTRNEEITDRNIRSINDRIALEFRCHQVYGEPQIVQIFDDLYAIEFETRYSRLVKFDEFLLDLIRNQDWDDSDGDSYEPQVLITLQGHGFVDVTRQVFAGDRP